MRKVELKFWGLYILFLLVLLMATSCKTKKMDLIKETTEQSNDVNSTKVVDNLQQMANQEELKKKELQELIQMLSQLNINYDGKSLDDKLDVLLRRTPEGTMLSFAGTGSANYKQDDRYDFSRLEAELFKRQDSLFKNMLNEVLRSQESNFKKHFKKEKEVKVSGGQAGLYITIGIVFIILVILAWIARKFKVFGLKSLPQN